MTSLWGVGTITLPCCPPQTPGAWQRPCRGSLCFIPLWVSNAAARPCRDSASKILRTSSPLTGAPTHGKFCRSQRETPAWEGSKAFVMEAGRSGGDAGLWQRWGLLYTHRMHIFPRINNPSVAEERWFCWRFLLFTPSSAPSLEIWALLYLSIKPVPTPDFLQIITLCKEEQLVQLTDAKSFDFPWVMLGDCCKKVLLLLLRGGLSCPVLCWKPSSFAWMESAGSG